MNSVTFALGLTMLAGLSTGIGSIIAYMVKKPSTVYLSFSLGLSAGVMVYVSFMELLPASLAVAGQGLGLLAFFLGIAFMGGIDILIPEVENPHHLKVPLDASSAWARRDLWRTGTMVALAIALHNFPEGIATFGTALADVKLGAFIALAIAIHNIPEGISVYVPLYCATGNKRKAFGYSFLSGLAEPLGALVGLAVLMPIMSDLLLACTLAFVAGIMVYISMDELLPQAHRHGHSHTVIFGLVIGMAVMAASIAMM